MFEAWPVRTARSGSCTRRRRGTGCTAPTATRRVAAALAPGGTLALFWNKGREWTGALGARQRRRVRRARAAPHELGRHGGSSTARSTRSTACAAFGDVTKRVFTWEQRYTTRRVGDAARDALRPPDPSRRRSARGCTPRSARVIDEHGGRVDVDLRRRCCYLAIRDATRRPSSVGEPQRDRGPDARRGTARARRSRAARRSSVPTTTPAIANDRHPEREPGAERVGQRDRPRGDQREHRADHEPLDRDERRLDDERGPHRRGLHAQARAARRPAGAARARPAP